MKKKYNSQHIVNGFFPHKNFGDDLFLALADKLIGDRYVIRNVIKRDLGYLLFINHVIASKEYTWLGGTFIDRQTTYKNLLSLLFEFWLAKVSSSKINLAHVGFSCDLPLIHRLVQKKLIKWAAKIIVRDKESFNIVHNINGNVIEAGDMVVQYWEYLTALVDLEKDEDDKDYGSVCVSVDKDYTIDRLDKVIDIINKHEHKICRINLIVSAPYQKSRQIKLGNAISEEIKKRINAQAIEKTYDYTSWQDVMVIINNSQIVVTDRLHVAIVAAMLNKKVIVTHASEKLTRLKQLLPSRNWHRLIEIG